MEVQELLDLWPYLATVVATLGAIPVAKILKTFRLVVKLGRTHSRS